MLVSIARTIGAARAHLSSLLGRRRRDAELDAEMRFHIDMATAKNMARGMTPEAAARAAHVAFGGRERFKEESRDARGGRWAESLSRDVRLAARGLARSPGFAITTVASLAVGIGCVVALFTLTDSVLLRPLPYADSDRIVALGHIAPAFGMTAGGQSEATFVHYRRHARSLDEIAVWWENDVSLTDGDAAERIRVALATPSLYRILGARAAVGRVPIEADATEPHVLISHELWVRRYGADSSLVGRTIEANRQPNVVIGVMPPEFDFPSVGTQMWYVVAVDTVSPSSLELFMQGIGRLRPGVPATAAESELAQLVPRLGETAPDVLPAMLEANGLRPTVTPLRDVIVRDVKPGLIVLACTALLVLIVAWANAASLSAVRAERRRREVAVARALGAGSGQLAQAFLIEALLLATAAGAIGLALASVAIDLRFGFDTGHLPRLHEVHLRPVGVGLGALLVATSAAVLALIGMLRVGGMRDVPKALAAASRRTTATREGQRVQRSLVAVQMALALTLLVAATMMMRSVWHLHRADPGFDPEGVLAFELNPPARPYLEYARAAGFHYDLLERLRGIPGVESAEVVLSAPLAAIPSYMTIPVAVDGASGGERDAPAALLNMASPGYFHAMRIPLLEGRTFASGDLAREHPAIILSHELARALFPGERAIGRLVRFVGVPRTPAYEVVGVAGGVPGSALAEGAVPTFYLPVLDDLRATPDVAPPFPFIPREATIVIRARTEPTSLLPSARRTVAELDPEIPVANARTMARALFDATARSRLTMVLLAVAAATTLFLGAIGIFGVVSYTVSLRTSEFGIRLALGARPHDVQRLVLRQGVSVAIIGVVLGVAGAVALGRVMRSMLYQVQPGDPVAFIAMPLVLLGIAFLASWLPARRAAVIDPARALRAE